jgi:hypothetical protein
MIAPIACGRLLAHPGTESRETIDEKREIHDLLRATGPRGSENRNNV